MKYSMRYNPPPDWYCNVNFNTYFFGLVDLCSNIREKMWASKELKMLEIGSYKGESTSIFAASALFSSITCIDPLKGEEEALEVLGDDWSRVKSEFWTNIRYWDHINLIQDYSYNVLNKFENKEFDFIYIDGNHGYKEVIQDIELCLPKCKTAIGGHDYHESNNQVVEAIHSTLGPPDFVFIDSSWIKYL